MACGPPALSTALAVEALQRGKGAGFALPQPQRQWSDRGIDAKSHIMGCDSQHAAVHFSWELQIELHCLLHGPTQPCSLNKVLYVMHRWIQL